MLQALIYGKIQRWLVKNASEIEDLLTAVVFGSCQYAGLEGWTCALAPFLGNATDSPERRTARKLADLLPRASSIREVSYRFWPSFPEFEVTNPDQEASLFEPITVAAAIPELIICLETTDSRKLFLLIEVKLNIGKSAGPSASPRKVGDQLAKYWTVLKDKVAANEGGTAVAAVYVTPWSFPTDEIKETRAELEKVGEHRSSVFWISWRDFVPAVLRAREDSQRSLPPIIEDVCKLLQEQWSFIREDIEAWPSSLAEPNLKPALIVARWPSTSRLGRNPSVTVDIRWKTRRSINAAGGEQRVWSFAPAPSPHAPPR